MGAEWLAMQIWRTRQRDLISRPGCISSRDRECIRYSQLTWPENARPRKGRWFPQRAPILPPCPAV
jgi:hypothetical protein